MTRLAALIIASFIVMQSDSLTDVWIMAKDYRVKSGDKGALRLVERNKQSDLIFSVAKSELVKAEVVSANASIDLLPKLKDDVKDVIEIDLPKEGTYRVQLRSLPKVIDLSADSLQVYAKAHDLDDVITSKFRDGNVKVLSSWYSAVYLQSGDVIDDAYKKGSGYPLEIVPAKNPYLWKADDKMKFTILWNGKPLFGARVIFRVTVDNSTGIQHMYTAKDGVVEAPRGRGFWVINVAKIIPSRNKDAHWQGYYSSVSFGN